MIQKYVFAASGYALAAVMFWLFVGAKSDLATEIEACNTRAETSAREAVEAVSAAQIDNYEKRLTQLGDLAEKERQARLVAEDAAIEAGKRPERVRTVIREVASENSCIDTVVPDAVLDSLRDRASGAETGDCANSLGGISGSSLGLCAPGEQATDTG